MAEGEREPHRVRVDRSEGFGERLPGVLLDRAHDMPPQMIAPLIAEEVTRIGGRDLSILLQDYEQLLLVPLPGERLVIGHPEPIDDTPAGEAFLLARTVEAPWTAASGCIFRCWTEAIRSASWSSPRTPTPTNSS